MLRKSLAIWVGFLMLIVPLLLQAATCEATINRINSDYSKFPNKPFPWKNLSWLQQTLGHASAKKIAGHKEYTWRCSANTEMYLTATTDSNDQLVKLTGQYSSENGEGLLSIPLTNSPIPQSEPMTMMGAQQAEPVEMSSQNKTIIETNPAKSSDPQSQSISATACKNAFQQVGGDTKQYGLSLSQQQLPWKNLSWWQQTLGHVQAQTITQTLYQWDNYNMLISPDGSRMSTGTFPGNSVPHSLAEATSVLGAPKATQSQQLNQYKWNCPDQGQTTFTLIADQNGKLLTINAQKLEGSGFAGFVTSIGQSALEQQLNKQFSKQMATMSSEILSKAISDYNAFFKTTVKTEDELSADAMPRVKKYYASLRQCEPGTFQYAQLALIFYIFPTSTIKGMQNNVCVVETNYEVPGSEKVSYQCQFSQQSLALFTDQAAEQVVQGQDIDTQHLTPLQQVMKTECKIYLNGKLQ